MTAPSMIAAGPSFAQPAPARLSGVAAATGTALAGADHLAQSIADILTTPIGTRVMRRDYGSDLPALIDAPQNAETALRMVAATAAALRRWEPRFRLARALPAFGADGAVTLTIIGVDLSSGADRTLTLALRAPASS